MSASARFLIVAALAAAGCGGSLGAAPSGTGGSGGMARVDDGGATEGAVDASDDAASSSACGGEIMVSGTTPSGPFDPTQLATSIDTDQCGSDLDFVLADADATWTLEFRVPFDPSGAGWLGVRSISAELSSTATSPAIAIVLEGTAEITMLDSPNPDPTQPLQGEAHVQFSFQGDGGAAIGGAVTGRYCDISFCNGPPAP